MYGISIVGKAFVIPKGENLTRTDPSNQKDCDEDDVRRPLTTSWFSPNWFLLVEMVEALSQVNTCSSKAECVTPIDQS